MFKEIPAHLRREENDDSEYRQEDRDTEHVLDGVIRMKRNAVERNAGLGILFLLDLDSVRIVRANLVQGDDVSGDQTEKRQRHCNHMEREKAV